MTLQGRTGTIRQAVVRGKMIFPHGKEIFTDGGRQYGLLLNLQFDVVDELLYFDFPSGAIRSAPIYDAEELLRMAEEYQNQQE